MYNLGLVGAILIFSGVGIGLLSSKLWRHMVTPPAIGYIGAIERLK